MLALREAKLFKPFTLVGYAGDHILIAVLPGINSSLNHLVMTVNKKNAYFQSIDPNDLCTKSAVPLRKFLVNFFTLEEDDVGFAQFAGVDKRNTRLLDF